MDRRSWLWRRKSSEKGPSEAESSGSASSYSERYSDDQEALRASPNNSSPNHAQSPEVSSNIAGGNGHETIKNLSEKLSAALINIDAKEEMVKQHMKVAEEAVSGWEKAETELVALKQQLEAAFQKNSVLEDRIRHLDGALKESIRQHRHSREEQEQKVHDALMKKTRECESEKYELRDQLSNFQVQLEAAKAEAVITLDHGLRSKLEASEKENKALKVKLLSRSEDLRVRTMEKELSTRAAETASKQHLESIKKVAKLEAECRRLHVVARRNDHKPTSNSLCIESLTDSQSDSGDRLFGADNEPCCSDSWASALISELDQFKNEKTGATKRADSSEIDLMDDFLEMERLVTMPEIDRGSSSFELETEANIVNMRDGQQTSTEIVRQKMEQLEKKVEKMEAEKEELEITLADARNRLELSSNQRKLAEDKLAVLQRHLDSVNESKLASVAEVIIMEENYKALESQLESAQLEVGNLHEKLHTLEAKTEKEKKISIESSEATRKALESQLETANFEVKKLRERASALECKVEMEKTISEEFAAKLEIVEGERMALEYQLELANLEVKKLYEMVDVLERKVEGERVVSVEFVAKIESVEAARDAMEYQLESARREVGTLHEKLILLEEEIKKERLISAEVSSSLEFTEAARKALEIKLQSVHMEVGKLRDTVSLLENEIEDEKALSAQLTVKCKNLEDDLSRKKRESEVQQFASSNKEHKINQEKDFGLAAAKLVECQKTIASLSQQLKSLTSLDDFVLADEKPQVNGDSKNLRGTDSFDSIGGPAHPNSKDQRFPTSSSSPQYSPVSVFARLASQSRSGGCTENQ